MKSDPNTWYLLQDGTYAAPSDCAADGSGVLRHKNGLAVAMRGDGSPQTVASGAVDNKNVEAAATGAAAAGAKKEPLAVAEVPAAKLGEGKYGRIGNDDDGSSPGIDNAVIGA